MSKKIEFGDGTWAKIDSDYCGDTRIYDGYGVVSLDKDEALALAKAIQDYYSTESSLTEE